MGDAMYQLFENFDSIQDDSRNYGVFYPSDGNSADGRCRNIASYEGYDCPGTWITYKGDSWADSSKKGSGWYKAGNPYAGLGGGGTGCHFDRNKKAIDQTDAWTKDVGFGRDNSYEDLVQDRDCQCNYVFKDDWSKWVDNWIDNTKEKSGFEWRSWLAGGGGRAPAWALDTAICWMNNPRDMINLQNALWQAHTRWLNGMAPQWGTTPSPYWGWNEVPVTREIVDSAKWWDAVMIKLPAGLTSFN